MIQNKNVFMVAYYNGTCCYVVTALGKLKSIWLKQLLTLDSVRNVCYAHEVMQDCLYAKLIG
jgi:hypothetical protein